MLRALLRKAAASQERRLGESLDYVRDVIDASPAAAIKLGLFAPLALHRRQLPPGPYRVARLAAMRREDCGTCVQIEVNESRRDGVPVETLRAALEDRAELLSSDDALAWEFAQAVLDNTSTLAALRDRVRARFGQTGLVELSIGIASCRLYPTLKRGLGHAVSCQAVEWSLEGPRAQRAVAR